MCLAHIDLGEFLTSREIRKDIFNPRQGILIYFQFWIDSDLEYFCYRFALHYRSKHTNVSVGGD